MTLQYTYGSKGKKLGVFIPISEWKKIAKKYKELDEAATENPPTKQDILNGIKEGLEQVKLHKQGKVKLKTAQQLLDEL